MNAMMRLPNDAEPYLSFRAALATPLPGLVRRAANKTVQTTKSRELQQTEINTMYSLVISRDKERQEDWASLNLEKSPTYNCNFY